MPTFPAPVVRALAGLLDGSGRTLAIAGPPASGKSGLLEAIRGELTAAGHQVILLKGEYRLRGTPFGALGRLEEEGTPPDSGVGAERPDEGSAEAEGGEAASSDSEESGEQLTDLEGGPGALPPSPFAFAESGDEATSSRRARGGRRGTILGQTFVTRSRPAEARNPREYWSHLVEGFRARPGRAVAILVEDAVYVDPDSREFLIFLTDLARLRPVLLVYVLDTAVSSYAGWEERLLGRGDVDWVKFARAKPDPREVHRFKEAWDQLPATTQHVLGYAALMGGHVSEVSLSRVTRMTWRQLADALLPATEAKLVKVEAAKVAIPHDEWIQVLPDLIPDPERREMHREIAEALAALNPEPNLMRRLELAQHFYEWDRGPNALRYLLETAELTDRLSAFDTSAEVLEKALTCLPSLPAADRTEAEVELRMFLGRVLIAAGRPTEGTGALREGMTEALLGGTPHERLEEWIERAIPLLRAAGPRASLVGELVELADRCHDAGAIGAEVLLQSTLAEYEIDRHHPEKAQKEAIRAAAIARGLGRGPIQAVALLVVGLSCAEGTPDEQRLAEKFLRSAEGMLGSARRYELQQIAEEVQIRLLEERGDRVAALRAHERGAALAQRMRALAIELSHQVGIADLLIEQPTDARLAPALKRGRELTELLHLLPPAPALLRLWLLEGRWSALSKDSDGARDRWEAIADLTTAGVSPRLRAEAVLRLALLELDTGREEAAIRHLALLDQAELRAAMRPEWEEWRAQMRRRAGLEPPTSESAA